MHKRLLILSPKFHGYWRSIERSFETLGWQTTSFPYDQRSSLASKAVTKFGHELPTKLGLPALVSLGEIETKRAIETIDAVRPDRVLIIKGDRFTPDLHQHLTSRSIATTLWLYDELRRTAHTNESLTFFDAIATYSHEDAKHLAEAGYETFFVPNAFDPQVPISTMPAADEISFIGARYPKRERAIQAIHDAGVPVRAYGRDWSSHLLDRARTWRLQALNIATERDISLEDAYAVMAASAATINIHSNQDGFTMRTFEASGVGALQLIDRDDVCEFYEPGREVLVFGSHPELIDHCKHAIADPSWAKSIRDAARERTLAEHTFAHRAKLFESIWA